MAPEWEDVLRLGEERKELWTQWDLLTLVDGMLYRKGVTGIGHSRWTQLVTPKGLRKVISWLVHEKAAGHLGIRKTLEQLRRRAFLRGWRGDVERNCRACDCCNRYHRGSPPRQALLHDMTMRTHWKRIGIDLTVRHPRSREVTTASLHTSIISLNSRRFTRFRTRRLRRCVVF